MTLESFGARELEVLRVLWGRGPSTVAEVRAALRAPLAYTTVLTILRNLEAKQAVAHREIGRAHRFYACVDQVDARRSAVGRVVDRLFDGRMGDLLTRLVDARALDRGELERLRALLDERLDGAERADAAAPAGRHAPDGGARAAEGDSEAARGSGGAP